MRIDEHALIGNTRSAALVTPHGSIDWLCLPRFDSPPVFGRLIGGDEAGSFELRPAEQPTAPLRRLYRDGTATVETTWFLEGGELVVADSMVAEVAGSFLPGTLLVRRVSSRGRAVRAILRVDPRFGYDRQRAKRSRHMSGALVFEHGPLALSVATDATSAGGPVTVLPYEEVELVVEPGRPVTVVLTASHQAQLIFVPPALAAAEAERDEARWREWSAGLRTPATHREEVVRSLVTLQLLTYSPSGAPVAAPTTSLPEHLGGGRNWDYRYAWPRDASIGIAAFLTAGKREEAVAFLSWLLHASRLARPRLPALFTLDGRPGPAEQELEGWPGYADSRPVRVGNGASEQHQLDGYGWVLDAAWLATDAGHHLDGEMWRTIAGYADRVADTWMLADAGIWERRDDPRHHVHSKLMAWMALDRAARIARARGGRATRHLVRWTEARDQLGADVRERGYDESLGAYSAAYGSGDLDAAVLVLPLVGLEPEESRRVASTIDAIRTKLGAGGPLLYRYVGEDGLAGREGAFLPCSFWLVQALARIGRREEAVDMFEELLAMAGPLGLFAEEMDPDTREHLGNYPQALTHAALLQAAFALDAADVPAKL